MATNPILFFFLLFTLFLQLHARESQFFSKFNPKETQLLPTSIQPQQEEPNFIPQTKDSAGYGLYGYLPPSTTTLYATNGGADYNLPTTVPENYNTVVYTTPVNSKDSYETTDPQYDSKNQYNGDSSMDNKQKQDKFYGHLPPLTTTSASTNGGADDNLPTTLLENYNTVAYTTPIHSKDSFVNTDPQYGNKDLYNGDSSMYNNQYMYNSRKQGLGAYGGSMYNSQKQGMSETRFMDKGDTGPDGGNMYNTEKQGMSDSRVLYNGKYYHVGDMYNSHEQGMGETRFMDKWDGSATNDGNMYNTKKQGMSDTRFMENGKYYYDLNSEGYNANGDVNPRGFESRNGYNTRGYYGNNDNSYNRYNSNAQFLENQEDVFTP